MYTLCLVYQTILGYIYESHPIQGCVDDMDVLLLEGTDVLLPAGAPPLQALSPCTLPLQRPLRCMATSSNRLPPLQLRCMATSSDRVPSIRREAAPQASRDHAAPNGPAPTAVAASAPAHASAPAPAHAAAPVVPAPAAAPAPARAIQHVYARRPASPAPLYFHGPARHKHPPRTDGAASSSIRAPLPAAQAAPTAPRVRVPRPPPEPHPMVTRARTGSLRQVNRLNLSVSHTAASPIPTNYCSALADPNWRAAMVDEYKALIDNYTVP